MKSNTLILHAAALFIMPLQLLFSIFLLLRGHDEPGGGFIGGLVVASAFVLYAFAFGQAACRRILRVDPKDLLAAGLLLALVSAVPSILSNEPLLTAHWWNLPVTGDEYITLSTPLVFDVGVYLTVLGTIMTFVISLMESDE